MYKPNRCFNFQFYLCGSYFFLENIQSQAFVIGNHILQKCNLSNIFMPIFKMPRRHLFAAVGVILWFDNLAVWVCVVTRMIRGRRIRKGEVISRPETMMLPRTSTGSSTIRFIISQQRSFSSQLSFSDQSEQGKQASTDSIHLVSDLP